MALKFSAKVKINFKISLDLKRADLASLGNQTVTLLRKRTKEGKDYKENAFEKYSNKKIYVKLTERPKPQGGRPTKNGFTVAYDKGYPEYKEASAKHYKGYVDLTRTGKMLNSMFAKPFVRQFKIIISFRQSDAKEKAWMLENYNKKRIFLGFKKGTASYSALFKAAQNTVQSKFKKARKKI